MAGMVRQVQKAVMGALLGDAAITVAVTGVYDAPPPETAYPYILVGVAEEERIAAEQVRIYETLLQVHIYIREPDRFSLFDLASRIREVVESISEVDDGQVLVVRSLKAQARKVGRQGSFTILIPFRFVTQEAA